MWRYVWSDEGHGTANVRRGTRAATLAFNETWPAYAIWRLSAYRSCGKLSVITPLAAQSESAGNIHDSLARRSWMEWLSEPGCGAW